MFNSDFGIPRPISASASGVNGFKLNATNYQWGHNLAANPTTRPDGSPLISGDRIYDSTTGEEWWWNGTLWLSPEFRDQSWVNSLGSGSNIITIFDTPIGRDVFIKEVSYSFFSPSTATTTATTTLTTTLRTPGPASVLVFTQALPTGTVITGGIRHVIKQSVGLVAPVKTIGANFSGVALSATQNMGFSLQFCSFGMRGALVR